jgi:hypothetical protein
LTLFFLKRKWEIFEKKIFSEKNLEKEFQTLSVFKREVDDVTFWLSSFVLSKQRSHQMNPCELTREDFRGELPGGAFLNDASLCRVCQLLAAKHQSGFLFLSLLSRAFSLTQSRAS